MATRTRWVFAVAALVLSACQPNRFVSGWVPYWGGPDGRTTINDPEAALLLSDVSMLWFQTDDDGTVDSYGSNASLQATIDATRAQGLPVIPAIFDSTATGVMSGILADPVKRAGHVQNIVQLVMTNNFDGIDIDYEVFAFNHPKNQWPAITLNWVKFVEELAGQLHARGKLLSVTVPPVWDFGSPTDGVFSGYTVYAQDQIAPFVDRLRLMVYDWSITVPGSIAPMFWVNSVIAYSSARVPVSKLQLGVPSYGRHWATQKNPNEVCPDGAINRVSVQMTEVAALAAAHGVTPTRHADGELTFGWTQQVTGPRTKPIEPPVWNPPATVATEVTAPAVGNPLRPAQRLGPPPTNVTCTVQHTVFVPDAISIRQRADAALAADWSGIVIFALGYETLDVYDELSKIAPQRPNGAVSGSLSAPTVTANNVRITGQALHPEFDLPLAVRLTVTPTAGGTAVVRTVTARASVAGMPDGVGPFHGIDETIALASGSYTVCADVLHFGGAVALTTACQPFTVVGTI